MWQAVVLLSWWLLGSLASCCPQHCRCFTDDDGYKVANCSMPGLLSRDPAPTIDILNFRNQLRGSQTKLEPRIFRNFRGVTELNLQNTSISHLPNDVFHGLTRVVRIDLSFNKIKHLNGVVFKNLPSLKYLSLRGNFLSISPLESIVSQSLQDLDMGLCSLTNIPEYAFNNAPSLRHLILDGNFIETIEYNVLPRGLAYLNLANNNIVTPPLNVFNSLRHLVRLDISNNPVNCSCSLLVFQDKFSGRASFLENDVVCANPPHIMGRKISSLNENLLCQEDYLNRRHNSLIYLRAKKSHHKKDSNNLGMMYQSDGPIMGDESYSPNHSAEVMFTNEETNQMGTHMEARSSIAADTQVSSNTADTISTDAEEGWSKNSELPTAPEAYYETDKTAETAPWEIDHSTGNAAASELGNTVEVETITSEDKALGTSDEGSSTHDNTINTPSSDLVTSSSDHSNTLHALDVGNKTDPIFYSMTSHNFPTDITQNDEPAELTSHTIDEASSVDDITTGPDHSGSPTIVDESVLHTDDSTTEQTITTDKLYSWPTSATELIDYSYDSHHDDYGVTDNLTSSETIGEEFETKKTTTYEPETEFDEGSGDGSESMPTIQHTSYSSSTIGFMEEQETESESSSLRTVNDGLDYVSTSSDSSSDTESGSTPLYSSTTVESAPTETSSIENIPTESSTTESSFYEFSYDSSSSTDISTTNTVTEMPTEESTITDTETSTDSTSEEPYTTIEPTSLSTDETELSTTDISTEYSTVIPTISSSSEPSSTEVPITDIDSSSSQPRSTELLSITEVGSTTDLSHISSSIEPSSSTESSSSSTSPYTKEDEDLSSSSTSTYKKGKMVEFTTEISTVTADTEVVIIPTGTNTEDLEKIVIGEGKEVEHKPTHVPSITYFIIAILVALILILLSVIVCRRKNTTKKVRLPVDLEATGGTEMQDMLLPKPPENGIKVLPKNYTNGTTHLNGKAKEPEVDKEETIPVLAPEPELDVGWEEKPEPIEAVTARLTMLARPQTPIFIQKTLT